VSEFVPTVGSLLNFATISVQNDLELLTNSCFCGIVTFSYRSDTSATITARIPANERQEIINGLMNNCHGRVDITGK
jgi:hypothetical protein